MDTIPNIFINATLEDKITLSPRALCKNKTKTFQNLLATKFEGVCSYHGYIKSGSITVVKYTAGMIKDVCLNGDVEYHVTYEAQVCNPAIGSILEATVLDQNAFGIIAEVKLQSIPILEVVIIKKDMEEDIQVERGQVIHIEIIKKKFELRDRLILNVGKLVK